MQEGIRKGPTPFRFEVMWLRVEGFKELLKGWYSFVLAEKLKALKAILKTWNREVFGRVELRKVKLLVE